VTVLSVLLALPLLYFISRYNYNLFHSFADGISIVIAACAFTIIWNSRHVVDNHYFLYIGIAFLFFAFLDSMHVLGNKNMGIFPEYGNLGPTFYIASRYVLSLSFLIAPVFINRKLNTTLMFTLYSLVTLLILLSIFYWKIFPACIVEGVGLTPFKIVSDYIICLILLGAIGLLVVYHQSFDSRVLRIIVSSIILFIATGLTFALYTDPFGITNLVGHLFQVASFYLVYLAFIETSVTKPQEILYRRLKQHEEALTNNLRELDYANIELQREIAERKQVEMKLQSTLRRFFTILSNAYSAILLVSDESLVEFVNQAFCDYFGLTDSPEGLIGLTSAEMFDKIDQAYLHPDEALARIRQILAEGRPVRGEEVRMKGGRTCLRDFHPLLVEGISYGRVWFHLDITARKQAQINLEKMKDILSEGQKIAHVGTFEYIADTQITVWSDEEYRIYGLDPTGPSPTYDVMLAKSIHPDDTDLLHQTFTAALQSGSVYELEHRIVHTDGSIRWVYDRAQPHFDQDGKLARYVGATLDITEHKRLEEELSKRQVELQSLFNNSNAGLVLFDAKPPYRVLAHNKYYQELFAEPFRTHGMVGKNLYEYAPEVEAQGIAKVFDEVARTAKAVELLNFPYDSHPPERLWFNWHLSPVIHDGEVVALASMSINVTNQHLAEEALRKIHDELELSVQERTAELTRAYDKLMEETKERAKLEEQLRQSQKMEAIGTLAGGIAHDFNNILAAIIGFTEMVEEDLPPESQNRPRIGRVLKAASRGKDLVRQILAFSRKTELERKPLSLSSVIHETFQLLRASLPTTIEMNLGAKATRDTILATPAEVQQIIMNLATNAFFAMREKGGVLSISTTDIDFEPDSPVLDADVEPGEYVQLVVADTGHGMEHQVMQRVFEPFFTTKGVGEGTGMGLAVVYGIVKSLHGTIAVESEPGKGSTFRICLPMARADENQESVVVKATPRGTEHILIIDDEELLVEWGQASLERLGYSVTALTDSMEALKLFSVDPSRFDLVITDQTMPNLTGLHLARKLMAIRTNIPIILCTGHSDSVSPEKARETGIKEFLMKPLGKQQLAEVIRKVLNTARSEG
jgi:PAS domain S-box-containing protein